MKAIPVSDRVLIRPLEEKDNSSFITPEQYKKKSVKGKVVDIGPLVEEVKKGDTVLYGPYSGTNFMINKTEYLLMKEDDVLLILEK